jgi:hypothetical protein
MGRWSSRLLVGVSLGSGVCLMALFFLEGVLKVFGEVAGPVVGVLAPIAGEVWRARRLADPRPVDASADLLAHAVRAQWRKAAVERVLVTPAPIPVGWSLSDLQVAGPVEAAVGDPDVAPAFPPLPGQRRVSKEDLQVGGGRRELLSVYAGLASGRVVVVGAPGAGKTGSAVLLVLDALEHRDHVEDKDRARVPVPVLLTAQGWDPATCPVQDWLAARLAATYPLFRHRGGQAEAAELVAAGAVALVLDGLDEMDVARRPAALQALSDASFRVVVLTRSQEMVQAAGIAWLVGAIAVHLRDITGPQGADYLHRARTGPAPAGWTQLLTHLRDNPDSVVAHGLSTPLALTLIRDTFRPSDDVSDLLDTTRCGTTDDIEQHLIARVIPDAYTPRPGRPKPPYSEAQARQALAFFARQMNQDHTRDLGWWQVPRWVPTRPRRLISMLASMLVGGLLGGPVFGLFAVLVVTLNGSHVLWTALGKSALFGVMFGLAVGLPLGLGFGRSGREPNRIRTWRAISVRSVLTAGLAYGLALVLAVGLVFVFVDVAVGAGHKAITGWFTGTVGGGLVLVLAFGLTVGLPLALPRNLLGSLSAGESSSQRPVKNQHKDRVIGLVAGLVAGIAATISSGIGGVGRFGFGFGFGLVAGLVGWLAPRVAGVIGLGFGLVAGIAAAVYGNWTGDRIEAGLGVGVLVGVLVVVVVWLIGWLVPQLAGGLVAGLAVGATEGESIPQGPLESWRNDRVFGLVTGLSFGLASGLGTGILLSFGVLIARGNFPVFALVFVLGPVLGLAVGLLYGITSSVTWSTTLAWRLQLQHSRRVPAVGLMPFLEDALDRGVLRTVGAVYQFRHATLQDHLAGPTTSSLSPSSAIQAIQRVK